jgi:hypothetical protein
MAGGVSSSGNAGISNNHEFFNPEIIGSFSLACAYWISTETTTVYSPRFYNSNPSASSYCNICDGQNHFGVSSTYSPITLPADTALSFNSMLFIQPDFRLTGGGAARWMAATSDHQYINGFIAITANIPATVLWQSQSSGGGVSNLLLNDDIIHQGNMSDIYLIAGPQAAPPLYGLSYRDPSPYATNSVFKCDPSITGSVYVTDCTVRIMAPGNGTIKLWDNVAKWDWSGNIAIANVGSTLLASRPAAFQGRLSNGHSEQFFSPLIGLGTNSTNAPTFTTGNGAPSGGNVQPNGSLYIRRDGSTGTRWYISAGGGTWTAVAGI